MQSGKEPNINAEYFEIQDPEFQASVDQGVMSDEIGMSRVVFWTVATSVLVVILIAIAYNLYKFYKFDKEFQQAVNVEYRELNEHRAQNINLLNELEVIDEEQGIFRIPVDSAKTLLINRSN